MEKEWVDYYNKLLCILNGLPSDRYSKLLWRLHNSEFIWVHPGDQNRYKDGVYLREYFGFDFINPGSILEVLTAFASRIDNEYIGSPGEQRPDIIFMEMLRNLNLLRMDDDHYDEDEVYTILDVWMHRRYFFDGKGSIFQIRNPIRNQRKIDMWSQMLDYISENYS